MDPDLTKSQKIRSEENMKTSRNAPKPSAHALVALVTLSLLAWHAPFSLAQTTTASVSGVVSDPQGAAITEAKITIRNIQTNVTRSVNTYSEGRFLIKELAPGEYEVGAEHQGF